MSTPLIFESTSTNPYHNLSIEDYLLRNSHPSSRILFFYTNRPCVVIGRNQNPWLECNLIRLRNGLPKGEIYDSEDRNTSPITSTTRSVPIDLVRRRSGGGTVFHDLGNLNYSLIVPNDKDFNRRKHAEMVVRGLKGLRTHHIPSQIKVNDRHDIVMQKQGQQEWLKVSGSAFKLTRGRALHHGTLLFSSPYIHQISGLLRSPGRDYIRAKGVESVRSKVGNLTSIEDRAKSEKLREEIVENVTSEFMALCGRGTHDIPGDSVMKVSDIDCDEQINSAIAKGVTELMTAEWRFGQTPRFEFDSGVIDGFQLQLHANRGIIERVKVEGAASDGSMVAEGVFVAQTHLHSIEDWKVTLRDLQTQESSKLKDLIGKASNNKTLMDRIESTFPNCG